MADRGRPSTYTKEIAKKICDLMAQGKTVRQLSRENDDVPGESTIRMWALNNVKENPEDPSEEGFFAHYARARDLGLDVMSEEVIDIADDGTNDFMKVEIGDGIEVERLNSEHIQRSRLRVDTRKWYLSKLAPKRYGDKLELSGNQEAPLTVQIVRYSENENG